MKKSLFFLLKVSLTLSIVWLTSCKADEILNVCTTCTESNTGVSDSYCGTIVQVEAYESSLQNAGTWTCVRN